MTKVKRINFAKVVLAGVVLYGLLWISGMFYDVYHTRINGQALQNRTDFGEIVTASVALARAVTNDLISVSVADSRVPALLRSLSPRSINVRPNEVTMEFHGGFDHYGYRVRQADANHREWTLYYYTEHGEKPLTTVTQD